MEQKGVEQFEKAIAYVEEDSIANANKSKVDILARMDGLLKHPEKYSPDRYKVNNDGSFRAFELHSYRVSYRVKGNEIRIIKSKAY